MISPTSQDIITIGGCSLYIPQSKVGANSATDTAGLYKILRGGNFDGVTARGFGGLGDYTSLKANAVSYQVPASGLTVGLIILAVRWIQQGSGYWQLIYGDTAIQQSVAAGPTNPIYQAGVSGSIVYNCQAAGQWEDVGHHFIVPPGKYISMQGSGGANVTAIGVLV